MATDMSGTKLTYHRRLFLWLAGYSLLLVGCFVVFQYNREKEFKADKINAQLQLINVYIINELEKGISIEDIPLDDFHSFNDLRISVIDPAGTVAYDNTLDTLPSSNHLSRREIAKAVVTGSGYTVRHSESNGNTYFYAANKGDNGIIVRTAVPYTLSLNSLLRADYGFLWFMGFVTVVMCLLGYFATRRLGQHISRLNSFAECAEKGEKICDTESFPHDELGEISSHIVRLYARLQQALWERDREHSTALHEQKEKERIKKQLTNNINHELKTPVAAIQLCLETLKSHPDLNQEKRMEFIDRSLSNSDRLKKLLADVSLITRMEDGSAAIEMVPVNLADVIKDVVTETMPIARQKGFDIDIDLSGDMSLQGNRAMLESIFHNLIDNAVAYSGGNLITVRLTETDNGKTIITVADNGNGIAEEHLPRIFERFYRIDKGRSRAAGGTGLGLSIVKNAVLLHHGTIIVKNRPDGGLLFKITFPSNRPSEN